MNKLTLFCVFLCCSILVACSADNYAGPAERPSPDTRVGAENRNTGSWLDISAKRSSLVYVTDGGNASVTVYSYDDGQLVGTLQGFSGPSGLCVDSARDIFVTDTQSEKVFEYAHGGTQPINELETNGQQPVGCAVDPLTANLAVASVGGSVWHFPQREGFRQVVHDRGR